MSIQIIIAGESASEALAELKTLAGGMSASEGISPVRPVSSEHKHIPADYEEAGNAVPTVTPGPSPTSAPEPQEGKTASPSEENELDSDGVAFDEDIHTGTKLKDGRWRMKKGCERPEPMTDGSTSTESDGEETSSENEGAVEENAGDSEDDEFAAFTEAAASSDAKGSPEVPERSWTDADLGQLCNDAAVKLNDPAPVKALIAEYVPEGEVPHSRNIPNESREAFAQAIEAKAGIEYAG